MFSNGIVYGGCGILEVDRDFSNPRFNVIFELYVFLF